MMKRDLVTSITIVISFPVITASFAGSMTPPPLGPTMKSLAETDPGTPISSVSGSPTSVHLITEPGAYILDQHMVGTTGLNGIEIASDNVTIDLRGFALIGVPGSLDGISDGFATTGVQRSCLLIKNGTVRGWGERGINLGAAVNSTVAQVHVRENGTHGIVANGPGLVEMCTATSNGQNGIQASHNRLVRACVLHNNGGCGLYLASGCVVNGCSVTHNGSHGIHMEVGGAGGAAGVGRIVDCAVGLNEGRGISCETGATISGCNVYSNRNGGIYAPNSLIHANAAVGNTPFDIEGPGATVFENHTP